MTETPNIQLTIDEANKWIGRFESLERLMANPDFKEVVFEAYFKEEPARLASLVGDIAGSYRWAPVAGQAQLPDKQFVQMQESIERDIHAIGALQSFFRVLAYRAQSSKQALEDIEAQKNEPQLDGEELDADFPEA